MALDGAEVTDDILRQLLAEGRARCQLDGHVVIQSMPTSYVVDEALGVRDPSGMVGQRIGVSMHAVAVTPTALANLRLAVERCHLNVAASLFAPYASGLSVLTDDEKQLGCTILDMGGGCTSIAVFLEGHLVHADVVPIGGQAVTNDLAVMLSSPVAAAERAKVLYGAALGDLESGADVVSVPQMGEENEEGDLRVPRSMLTRIIQARLEETFGEVQKRLRDSGYDVAAGRRLVLTGGASQLAGARELAARVLNKQVRVGRPRPQSGMPASSAGPDYATAIGLLMAGATMPPEVLNPELALHREENGTKGWLSRLTGGLIG
jgi:cell division protein FtsA